MATGVLVVAALFGGGGGRRPGRDQGQEPQPSGRRPHFDHRLGRSDPGDDDDNLAAQAVAQLLSGVSVSPANGATKQGVKTVITVRAKGATLEDVVVTGSVGGTRVVGNLDAPANEWQSRGSLLPGSTYTVSYDVAGNGLNARGSGTFRTVDPAEIVTASVFPSPGIVVGVGQPIVFDFSAPVNTYAAQQAVLARLKVAMSKPVPGGWHWFSSVELHFRPSSYWPVGEQVSVNGNLNGWDLGGGAWGEGTVSTAFVVGDSHISYANLVTHEMTVTDNGQVLYSWPISAGSPKWPTMDGTHIVLDRESVVHMVSSTVGIPVHSPAGYDEFVYWDVHISDSGEYVHAAPWSVSDQGIENVSHGCINLSPDRAETFFRFSRVGDVVQVLDGPRPPAGGPRGHGLVVRCLGGGVDTGECVVALHPGHDHRHHDPPASCGGAHLPQSVPTGPAPPPGRPQARRAHPSRQRPRPGPLRPRPVARRLRPGPLRLRPGRRRPRPGG